MIETKKTVTKTTGLFLEDGCIQLSLILMNYDNEAPIHNHVYYRNDVTRNSTIPSIIVVIAYGKLLDGCGHFYVQ